MSADSPPLQLAHCRHCGHYSFPAQVYGCRRCGAADGLSSVPCPQVPLLKNFVTVFAELAPGLPVPCVIGEVALAPGVVEEALIAVADEAALALDMPLRAECTEAGGQARWQFVPVEPRP